MSEVFAEMPRAPPLNTCCYLFDDTALKTEFVEMVSSSAGTKGQNSPAQMTADALRLRTLAARAR